MAHKDASKISGYVADTKVVDVEKRYYEGPKHYVYVIKVTWANPTNTFIIYRRFNQFFDLQCKLLDRFAETPAEPNGDTQTRQIPFLHGKIFLGRSQIRQIALERKESLQEYCQNLISLPERISRSAPVLEFFHPSSTDVRKPAEASPQEKKPVDKTSLAISGPAQLESYRCLGDFTATEKLEMSLKRNSIVKVLQKHDNGWWFVQFGDQTGFVPGSYLQPSDLKQGVREGKTVEKSLSEKFIVNKSYEAAGKDELSLHQGSFVTVTEKSLTGWWKIKFNNLTGYFPAIYLTPWEGRRTPDHFLDEEPSDTPKKKELSKSMDSDEDDDVHDDGYSNPSKADPELYYAHTDFSDRVGDCLSFKRGDIIEIHDKHQSGWWFGRRMKGDSVLSWVPANYLQKEPLMDTSAKNPNSQPWNSKFLPKSSDKTFNPIVNAQPKEEKAKVSTPTIRQNFSSQSSVNRVESPNLLQKEKSVTTATTPKISHVVIPGTFRSINEKQETNTPAKTSAVTNSPLFRPVGVKQATAQMTPKSSPISTPTVLRPIAGKQETATTPKTPSGASSSAFRPMNYKLETPRVSNHTPNTISTAFRPVIQKQETSASQNRPPVTASITPRPSLSTKQEPTQKSVKDLVGKFNDK